MAIDDLYTVTARYCTPGGSVSISQGYKQTLGTNNKDTLQDLVDKSKVGWAAKLLLALSTQATLDVMEAQAEAGVDEVPGYQNYTGQIGAIAGQAVPNNVAAIISQLTDAPNSNANGRVFVAGVSEAGLLANVWTVAQLTLLQTFADDLDDDITSVGGGGATFQPVVISKVFGGVPRSPFMGFQILSSNAKANPRQQRRRNSRRFGVT